MQQASDMAGIEGERSQNKEAGHPSRAFMEGERYERSEKHYGGIATSELRLRNGQPRDIGHLYTERDQDGQLIWWTERQSIASWQDEVRVAHERGDPRYENIPENKIPASITHNRASIYEGGGKRPYAGNNYAFIEYISSSDQHDSTNTIQVLNEPVTTAGSRIDTGKGAEPKRDRSREGEGQDGFAAGRGENSFYEETQEQPGEEDKSQSDLPPELQALIGQLRARLRVERERQGEGFNEAEYFREQLDAADTRLGRKLFLQGGSASEEEEQKKWFYGNLLDAFDALAYDRYTSEKVQNRALARTAQYTNHQATQLYPQEQRGFAVIASVFNLPYNPDQMIVPTSLKLLAELRGLGYQDSVGYAAASESQIAQARLRRAEKRDKKHQG